MNDEDVKVGDHCWALSGGEILVVLKVDDGAYEVCGPWECGIEAARLDILEVIPRPPGHENDRLYYD